MQAPAIIYSGENNEERLFESGIGDHTHLQHFIDYPFYQGIQKAEV
jgi:hypothetical protein